MSEFEKTIGKALGDTDRFDTARGETLRKEIVQMFDKKLKKVKLIAWAFLLIDGAIMIGLAHSFLYAENIKAMMALAIIFLVVYESTILIKLWYWVVNTKLNVIKEIKQLELQIAEMAGKDPAAEK